MVLPDKSIIEAVVKILALTLCKTVLVAYNPANPLAEAKLNAIMNQEIMLEPGLEPGAFTLADRMSPLAFSKWIAADEELMGVFPGGCK